MSSIPMHFVTMDLIGTFKPLPQEHQYIHTVIDMLTSYTWCLPLYTKETDEIVHSYLVNVYLKFGGSHKVLSVNGTEFKNKYL